MYADDYYGKLPPNYDRSKPWDQREWNHWYEYSEPYISKATRVWDCPNTTKTLQDFPIGWWISLMSDSGDPDNPYIPKRKIYEELRTSETMLFIDGCYGWKNTWWSWLCLESGCIKGGIQLRHGGQANALMLDGHVEGRFEAEIPDDTVFWRGE
jgi:prepilin-type processing-associated H-X9-DG protein